MTKKNLIDYITQHAGISLKESEEVVDIVLDNIIKSLRTGEPLSLARFGAFIPSVRKSRKGRNPATGKEMIIPEYKSVRFKPSKTLKEAVKEAPIDYSRMKEFKEAKRVVKTILSDVKLYHKELIQKSKEAGEIVPELHSIITDARNTYNSRVTNRVKEKANYFEEAIEELLKKK